MSNRQAREFAGLDGFVWFFGVVEDRQDPLHVGRVRVRCRGWHSDDRQELPTTSLPWAQVMTPVHSAAMSGIGHSPTGVVEGTEVIGFFLDGRNAQQPFIMGTVAGVPQLGSSRGEKGFTDPNANYPITHQVGHPDTPLLAYDRHTEDKITTDKISNRVESVPTASAPALSKVSRTEAIKAGTWNEPEQRGGTSAYPFNHVRQTESGHAFEVDDTPGAERIHEYHTAGTFYEIQPDGSKVTKIVGSDYQIVVKDRNVHIDGACNITIKGDSRLLVQGNLIEEINGDYHLTVHGSMFRKMDGNDLLEVGSARSEVIGTDDTSLVNGKKIQTTTGEERHTVNGEYTETIRGKETRTIGDVSTTMIGGKMIQHSIGDMNVASVGSLNMAAASQINMTSIGTTEMSATTLNIHNDQHITGTSTASVDHVSNGVSGHDHTHDYVGVAGTTHKPNV